MLNQRVDMLGIVFLPGEKPPYDGPAVVIKDTLAGDA
jgi:hypothetical protein